ncbi:lysyl oxidase, variant 2 [Blastomyces dermatitidis ER-3]|uniref:Amine oxidase n=2 Tax=Ajellomyces dermatitidis TaxID=5039 RepID=F2TFF8_AJEDA|nr:lysyl oxidase [Blastomyces dermatitidis ER-3]XP_045279021.1 lysyl oxidase, variant 1 [Blastomyces dermatitidis ER-3]XP_045279022.1 lysyl oxidase, variant 2 [Blastomyces dermatitidis ER-3]EGE81971.1 copper amine oxidase [Blastomyces dermatitidis ATCC 18188]KMW67650.1 copper amine oxidase, variant 1 [Blastomyces dermatitidis ATCC 18188]KMW67651.1 copper amine oxidase, variant 2 [Blastomyces dermatitidis ATCC 18188]OAS99292.1 lysyl oxidase [Blastomyces dermatitidis ER-3]OAS99293.1 lysyl oxid
MAAHNHLCFLTMLLSFLLVAGLIQLATASRTYPKVWSQANDRRLEHAQEDFCLAEPVPITNSPKTNVWAGISAEENLAVWELLHDPATGLNLTHPDNATVTDNYVFWIDALPTNKSAVLAYIDGDNPPPPKFARVIIFEGGREAPRSQEYMVGPLPVSSETILEPLDYIYNGGMGGSVPFNARVFDDVRATAVEPLVTSTMSSIAHITSALFQGGLYYGEADNRTTIMPTYTDPVSFDGENAFLNIMFRFPANSFLTPLDFFLLIDWTGTDPSAYSVIGFVTKERFFPTVDDLTLAFEAGELEQEFKQTRDASWTLLDRKPEMGTRALDEKFSATLGELGGKRYKLDEDQRYVEYMGWSFYMAHSRSLGLMFFDVKFKGERILYELSLQEALTQYGGNQPLAASSAFQDSHYSLGIEMKILLEGFDCPFGSTFLNLTYHAGNRTVINPDSICIFETDLGFPLSRHRDGGGESGWGFAKLGVVKGSALIIRAVATVGNYDYMFNYAFHLDGSLEISVRASGYLLTSPYYQSQKRWGPRIQNATQGSLHSHILTWKADFDIVDSTNSFEISKLVVAQQAQPWFPELGIFEQIELQASFLEKEERLNYEPNNQAMYRVVNRAKKNAWGESRGYRIVPGHSNVHLPISHSPFTRKNSEFAKQHLAVTRQHDNEPFANSVQNTNLAWKPQQDFSRFFNGESLDQEDLVVWVNMGMHHFTRSEDVPVTLNSDSYASMVFTPHNFFDRAQDGDLMNRRWVVADQVSNKLDFENYGVELPQCKIHIEEPVLGISPLLGV